MAGGAVDHQTDGPQAAVGGNGAGGGHGNKGRAGRSGTTVSCLCHLLCPPSLLTLCGGLEEEDEAGGGVDARHQVEDVLPAGGRLRPTVQREGGHEEGRGVAEEHAGGAEQGDEAAGVFGGHVDDDAAAAGGGRRRGGRRGGHQQEEEPSLPRARPTEQPAIDAQVGEHSTEEEGDKENAVQGGTPEGRLTDVQPQHGDHVLRHLRLQNVLVEAAGKFGENGGQHRRRAEHRQILLFPLLQAPVVVGVDAPSLFLGDQRTLGGRVRGEKDPSGQPDYIEQAGEVEDGRPAAKVDDQVAGDYPPLNEREEGGHQHGGGQPQANAKEKEEPIAEAGAHRREEVEGDVEQAAGGHQPLDAHHPLDARMAAGNQSQAVADEEGALQVVLLPLRPVELVLRRSFGTSGKLLLAAIFYRSLGPGHRGRQVADAVVVPAEGLTLGEGQADLRLKLPPKFIKSIFSSTDTLLRVTSLEVAVEEAFNVGGGWLCGLMAMMAVLMFTLLRLVVKAPSSISPTRMKRTGGGQQRLKTDDDEEISCCRPLLL
ncbi:hypothetical protein TYRP_009443 [Tyrophagus putrescentiae]|nr:hypothetical protein TYRP_009443 [Tyrophagus putrescentiae]